MIRLCPEMSRSKQAAALLIAKVLARDDCGNDCTGGSRPEALGTTEGVVDYPSDQ
jgi:hypothetical protein